MDTESAKTARVLFLYKKLLNGKKFTTDEAHDLIEDEFGTTSLRSIQRDLSLLQECEPMLISQKDGKKNIWKLDKSAIKARGHVHFEKNQILSFHILKAHLKAFRKTVIEEEMKALTDKLEEIAPQEVFSYDSLYWDQNIGQYDYTQKDPMIRRIIKYISEEQWVKVEYRTGGRDKTKKFDILLRCFFYYAGSLYCVAYVPYHGHHIALAVQYIDKLEPIEYHRYKAPIFDFTKWSKYRFGVYHGDLKKVVLRINKLYNVYFENRSFHQSQKLSKDSHGNLLIELRVPLVDDFISWLMSWGEAITVVKPKELIKILNLNLHNTLRNYE
ncbi:MAG: WYL domain-containing protein [bacterium]